MRGWCPLHYRRWVDHGDPSQTSRFFGDPEASFWQKARRLDDCWGWEGSTSTTGYAQMRIAGRLIRAHRWSYERWVGPIPEGYDVDHLCHNRDQSCPGGFGCPHRRCTNPAHLEAVTHQVNAQRGKTGGHLRERTHCIHGHPFDEANTIWTKQGHRHCRECKRRDARDRGRRLRATR